MGIRPLVAGAGLFYLAISFVIINIRKVRRPIALPSSVPDALSVNNDSFILDVKSLGSGFKDYIGSG
jgi:hypothetical protein